MQFVDDPFIGIISFVSQNDIGFNVRQEDVSAVQIISISTCQRKLGGIARSICCGMDLCC